MIHFNLDRAHPSYKEPIQAILTGLSAKYPFVQLKGVVVFEPKEDDRSMGNANILDIIALNGFWFSKPIEFLKEAAINNEIQIINGLEIGWHGPMVNEPDHVLIHEFGHSLTGAVKQWKEWTYPRWQAATRNPELAPSGYALGSVEEFFPEEFTFVELGFADKDRTNEMKKLLRKGGEM